MLQSKNQRRTVAGLLFFGSVSLLSFVVFHSSILFNIISGSVFGLILGVCFCWWIKKQWTQEGDTSLGNNNREKPTIVGLIGFFGIALAMLVVVFLPTDILWFFFASVMTCIIVVSGWSFFNHPPNIER